MAGWVNPSRLVEHLRASRKRRFAGIGRFRQLVLFTSRLMRFERRAVIAAALHCKQEPA